MVRCSDRFNVLLKDADILRFWNFDGKYIPNVVAQDETMEG